MNPIVIRDAAPGDDRAVYAVENAAFGGPAEAELVEALRGHPGVVSLVAVEREAIVGHVLFTPVTVVQQDKAIWEAYGLGPVAVDPARQRQGIGDALIRAGLERLRAGGVAVVFVLGHPSYYPRFGFQPAAARGLRFVQDVPPEAFMVLALREGALAGRARHGPLSAGVRRRLSAPHKILASPGGPPQGSPCALLLPLCGNAVSAGRGWRGPDARPIL